MEAILAVTPPPTPLFRVNGKHIEWNHIKDLYHKLSSMAEVSSGLSLLPKLKKEHVQLTSFLE